MRSFAEVAFCVLFACVLLVAQRPAADILLNGGKIFGPVLSVHRTIDEGARSKTVT